MADVLTREQRHRNMQNIRSKDTHIEIILRRELWKRGYRYRKNYDKLPGRPDIVLVKYKIAIFCDGEFFHGRDWQKLRSKLESSDNGEFWIDKISRNIERDEKVDKELMFLGWKVFRFWERDIKKNPQDCINVIEEYIFEQHICILNNEEI